jgi:hypothetical protein
MWAGVEMLIAPMDCMQTPPQAIGILLNDTLSVAERKGVISQMDLGNEGTGDGENLMWEQQVAIARGVINGTDGALAEITVCKKRNLF